MVVVEDHDDLRDSMVELFQHLGHQVQGLSCAEDLDDALRSGPVDVLVVDLNLPGEDGYSLTRRFRAAHPQAGIIMVTARHKVSDKVQGYESGADIYLPKPVDPEELLAAVAAVSRRLPAQVALAASNTTQALTVRVMTLKVEGPQGEERLSDGDVAVITALARAPAQRLELWQLLQILGLSMDEASKSSLEVRIVRLRKKLIAVGADKDCISNIRNVGYQLCVPVEIY